MPKYTTHIGALSSIAAHAHGQDKTPALLRKEVLLDDLQAVGNKVNDTEDLPRLIY